MQLIKDKNKIRSNQTGKLITDPTLDFFNKRLNVKFLNNKFGQTVSKIYDLKGLKSRNLVAFLKVKLFVENLRKGKKTLFFKNKRSHNLETLK